MRENVPDKKHIEIPIEIYSNCTNLLSYVTNTVLTAFYRTTSDICNNVERGYCKKYELGHIG